MNREGFDRDGLFGFLGVDLLGFDQLLIVLPERGVHLARAKGGRGPPEKNK